MAGDGEWGAEVYGCAADRQQASIVFDVACQMVEQCPALKKRIKPVLSQKRLVYTPLNSFYQVLSAESYTKHGLNVHGVVFDELHAQPNRLLYDVMTHGSGDARKQPLFFLITTAGTDRNSICWEIHQKAKDIMAGRKHDPTFYPVIYGIEDDDDWSDEQVWYKANPSLDVTVDVDKLRAAYNSAKENPAEENLFRQLRLNQWVKQSVRWMPMDAWDKCDSVVDPDELIGRECYAGLDLSSSTDITAFVLVFPPRSDDEKYVILPYFWVPEDTLALRVRRDHVPYDVWEKQGSIMTTEGNVIHYGYIEDFIEDLGTKYNIREIAYDRWGAVQMSQNLEGAGFTIVPFGQGFKDMSPPTKELMKLVLEGIATDPNHRYLSWEYCHAAFKQHRQQHDEATVDFLCLHLAWYLASWGMLRNSFLMQKDYKIHAAVVTLVNQPEWEMLWDISADKLAQEWYANRIMQLCEAITEAYVASGAGIPTETLLTKILLGTIGCVPAYDRYFKKALSLTGAAQQSCNARSLMALGKLYIDHRDEFEALRKHCSERVEYPAAKVIDMCFFEYGLRNDGGGEE